MRVYNLVDIINGKVPFEKKMYSSRGFIVKTPVEIGRFVFVEKICKERCLPFNIGNMKLYHFQVLDGPNFIGGYYRYRLQMYYELLPSTL